MLKVILLNIKNFAVKFKLIFALFILSQLISTISIIFVYGVVVFQQKDAQFHNQLARTFYVNSVEEFNLTIEPKLERLFLEKRGFLRRIGVFLDDNLYAEYFYPSSYNPLFVKYGKYFNEHDFLAGRKQIIISESFTEGSKTIGDYYLINNEPYEIIGVFLLDEYNEIPFKAISPEVQIAQVLVVLEDIPSPRQIQVWTDFLATLFPEAEILEPVLPDHSARAQNLVNSIISMSIGFLAVLNYSYLYRYVLMLRASQYATFRICGCSHIRGFLIYLGEVLLLAGGQFVLSVAIFHYLVAPNFSKINENLKYLLHGKDYLNLCIIYILVVLTVFIPVVVQYSRQSPLDLWRKDKV